MNHKKTAFQKFLGSGLIFGLALLWVFLSSQPFNLLSYVLFGILIFFGCYSLYQGSKASKNERAGLSSIDEFSKSIEEKAAVKTVTFSIFLWLFIMLFLVDWLSIQTVGEIKAIIFTGMATTVLFFVTAKFYFSRTGITDENEN